MSKTLVKKGYKVSLLNNKGFMAVKQDEQNEIKYVITYDKVDNYANYFLLRDNLLSNMEAYEVKEEGPKFILKSRSTDVNTVSHGQVIEEGTGFILENTVLHVCVTEAYKLKEKEFTLKNINNSSAVHRSDIYKLVNFYQDLLEHGLAGEHYDTLSEELVGEHQTTPMDYDAMDNNG